MRIEKKWLKRKQNKKERKANFRKPFNRIYVYIDLINRHWQEILEKKQNIEAIPKSVPLAEITS